MTKNGLIKLIEKAKKGNAHSENISILERGLEKWDETPDSIKWALTHRNYSDWLLED